MNGVRTHNFSGDRHGTDCTYSFKSNYHTITTTTAPINDLSQTKKINNQMDNAIENVINKLKAIKTLTWLLNQIKISNSA